MIRSTQRTLPTAVLCLVTLLTCLQYKAPRLTASGSGQQKLSFQQHAQPTSGTLPPVPVPIAAEELLAAAKLQNEELAKRVKVTFQQTCSARC